MLEKSKCLTSTVKAHRNVKLRSNEVGLVKYKLSHRYTIQYNTITLMG